VISDKSNVTETVYR